MDLSKLPKRITDLDREQNGPKATPPTERNFIIPWPPSMNHYWRNVNGHMCISKAGREYRAALCSLLRGSVPMMGRLDMVLYLWPPDRRRRDLDNTLKAIQDSLEHAGVYLDDGQIDRLELRRMPVTPDDGGEVEVFISTITVDTQRTAR
jgi:crossover junction endodeoxyribonuclease RusA